MDFVPNLEKKDNAINEDVQQPSNIAEQIAREEMFQEVNQEKQQKAIFIDYQPDILTQKIKAISTMEPLEMLAYTNHLAEILYVFEQSSRVIMMKEILSNLVKTSLEVKTALIQQIPSLMQILSSEFLPQELIRDIILIQVLFEVLSEVNLDFKQEVGKRIIAIIPMISEEDRTQHILNKVINMAVDKSCEENRIVAIQIFGQLAKHISNIKIEQFMENYYFTLADDPSTRVRRELIVNLPIIGKEVKQEFFNSKMLPFFFSCIFLKNQSKFNKEHIYGIKRACLEALADISLICQPKNTDVLSKLLLDSLEDQNKQVRVVAYKCLGPFISSLKNSQINPQLLSAYLKMSDSSICYMSSDQDIAYACAYNFPAVLYTVGAEKWSILQKTFFLLIRNKNPKVRLPIACALHEIGRIIGQTNSEKDLFKIYQDIIQSQGTVPTIQKQSNQKINSIQITDDDVKLGVVKNITQFLDIFDKTKRESMIDVFIQLQKDQKKWRIREMISRQIDRLVQIYDQDIIFKYIVPITVKLCSDPVLYVRKKTARNMHHVVISIFRARIDNYQSVIINNIRGFAQSNRFNQRQTFIYMCKNLMNYPEIFIHYFMESLESLSQDKVFNVRYSLAKLIYKHIIKRGAMHQNQRLAQIALKMEQDKAKEIQEIIKKLLNVLFPGRKIPNGEEEEKEKEKEVVATTASATPIQQPFIQQQQQLMLVQQQQQQTLQSTTSGNSAQSTNFTSSNESVNDKQQEPNKPQSKSISKTSSSPNKKLEQQQEEVKLQLNLEVNHIPARNEHQSGSLLTSILKNKVVNLKDVEQSNLIYQSDQADSPAFVNEEISFTELSLEQKLQDKIQTKNKSMPLMPDQISEKMMEFSKNQNKS